MTGKGTVSMEVCTYYMVVFVGFSVIYKNNKDARKSKKFPQHIDML